VSSIDKSSAVAEMGDRGYNRHGPKRGGAVPLSRGELGPRLTQCGLGPGLLQYQVASSSIQPFDHNRHGWKTGGCAPVGGAATPPNTTSPWPRFTSVPSGILTHPAVSPQQTWAKNWLGAVPLFPRSWVPIEHKVALAEAYLHTKWHLNPSSHLATTDMGRKLEEGLGPVGGGGAGSPSNTMWPGPRPTCMPSFILIRPTV